MAAKLSVHLVITLLVFAALIGSVFVQPAPASAATWYVDKAGTDDVTHGTGPGADAFLTISYAISRAGAGDTIRIGLGTWTEQVVIPQSLTLLGTAVAPTPNGTFIAAPADGARTNYMAGDGTVFDYVIVAHDTTNVSVSTLTVYAAGARKAGADYYATVVFDNVYNDNLIGFDSGCVSGAFNNNIADIDIAIWEDSFIAVENSLLVDFVRSGVECNGGLVRVRDNEINAEVPAAACVSLDHADTGVLIDNLLLSVGNGVVAADSRTVNIVGNELHGTAALNGIQYQTVESTFIQHNTIYGFQAGVIDSGTTAVGYIASNEIFDCADGIALNSATSTWESVYDNLIYDNGRGLYLACPLEAVSGNLFYHNTIGIEANNDLSAHCNAIMGSTTAGLNIVADGVFNVINNYWGDNSGPNMDGGGPGTGDNILTHGHTLPPIYNPWASMNLSATPATIVADGASTSTIDLDCTHNSDEEVMGCNIPDGLIVGFATTAGTLTSNTAPLSGGHAVTSLISSTTPGTATVGSAFLAAPDMTVSTCNVTFTAGSTVTTGTGVYVSPSWFYLTGNLTGLGAADTSVTPSIEYWGPADGTWTLATMTSEGPFSTPAMLETPPGDMPAGTYTFRARAQGNQSGTWAYGDIVTFIFQPPTQQPGINTGTTSHGSSLTTITTPGTLQLPNVQVTAARLSASLVGTGSPVTVTADVTNMGVVNGTALVRVYLNSEVAASQGVKVNSGSTTPVTFTITPSQPGEYSVRVNNIQAGTLKVNDVNDNDIIFAIAFAAFILIFAALVIVYLRQRRTAA